MFALSHARTMSFLPETAKDDNNTGKKPPPFLAPYPSSLKFTSLNHLAENQTRRLPTQKHGLEHTTLLLTLPPSDNRQISPGKTIASTKDMVRHERNTKPTIATQTWPSS